MKTQQKTTILIVLAVLLLASLLVGLLLPAHVFADVALKEQPAIRTDYVLGETLTVPQATLIVGGNEHTATAVVHYPDGNAVGGSQVTLSQVGKYTVQYKAKVDGWWYSDYVHFNVNKQPISINGGPSSTYVYDQDDDTINLNLAQKDTFNFNHPINLNGKTKDDVIFSAYVTSKTVNVRDFDKLVVVLTDAYDPTNKVYVRLMGDWCNTMHPDDFSSTDPNNVYRYARYQAYLAANLDGGKMWTFLHPTTDLVTTKEEHGLAIYFSLCNEANLRPGCENMTQEQDLFKLAFDAETNSLYHLGATPYSSKRLIVDLDDPAYFGGEFKGFTNNEVYLSVYADDVYTSANITITEIAYDGTLNDAVVDSTSPSISVDCSPYTQTTAPNAVVGKAYNIFPVSMLDHNVYDSQISKEVFLNYGEENAVCVDLVDGAFTPTTAGEYTIVYSKVDAFGNVGIQTVLVTAVSDAKELVISASDFTATAGVSQKLLAPTVDQSDDRTGRLMLTITASRNEIDDIVYQGTLADYQPIDYKFMMAGDWTISYTVADHSQSTTKTVSCNVDEGTSLIYDKFEDLDIEKTLVMGNTYYLPTVQVVSFTETQAIYTDAKIRLDFGGEWVPVRNNRFTVTEEMGNRVTITYYDENNQENCYILGTRDIINIGKPGAYKLDQLFTTDKATLTATDTHLSFTASQNAKIDMLTKQNAENLSIMFQLASEGISFKSLSILLTDSYDANVQIRITLEGLTTPVEGKYIDSSGNYTKVMAYSRVYLNGDTSKTLMLQSGFNAKGYYNLSFANMTKLVSFADVASTYNGLTATTCVNGSKFDGFPSGLAYVSFEMEVAGTSPDFRLFSINSQSMSNFGDDFYVPDIMLAGSYSNSYAINQTISTITANGMDVINGYCNAQVTVRRIGGGTVSTVDGKLIDKLDATKSYQFLLDQYGEYVVYYYSTDASGNTNSSIYYNFYVEDTEKPTIEIVSGAQQVVWTGTKFVMPELKISDNYSTTMYPTAVIVTPDGRRNAVNEDGYVFEKAGSYKVNIVVYDQEGNMAQVSYYVEVVENEK